MDLTKEIVPMEKVISIIDSCVTEDQLKNSKNLISNYMNHIVRHGCQNPWMVSAILKKVYKANLVKINNK